MDLEMLSIKPHVWGVPRTAVLASMRQRDRQPPGVEHVPATAPRLSLFDFSQPWKQHCETQGHYEHLHLTGEDI